MPKPGHTEIVPNSDANGAFQVSDRVELKNVVLVSAQMTRLDLPENVQLEVKINRSTRAHVLPSGMLRVLASLGFVARSSSSAPSADLVDVRATFELTYGVSDLEGLRQQDFDAFAELNGIFNAWPYFREFLQSSLVRMALPTFVLPVLRVGTSSPTVSRRASTTKSR